jgi:branched-chain amino acid transport system substrate-binding protein
MKNKPGIFMYIAAAVVAAAAVLHVRKQNSPIPIMASAWASVVPEFIGYGGRAVEGVYSIIECNDNSANPKYLAFKESYRTKFGHDPTLHGQNSYDVTNILLETLKKTMDQKNLKQELLKHGAFQGIDGMIQIDRNGEPIRPVYLMQIKDGRMQVVETLSSGNTEG